tara:strand:+ start:3748 stop:4335 length:588 start_codon:yes stop_codon:yes gene_type:complete
MISHKLKFIFIHIPKTSGNSLSLYLKDLIDNEVVIKNSPVGKNQGIKILCEHQKCDIKHASIDYYKKLYGEKINDYFKFTIVRNPYDRILSFYFWNKGGENHAFDRDEFITFVKKGISFQYEGIDNSFHIVYFENLIHDLKKLNIFKNHVDFNDYPTLNASYNSQLDYNEIYDKELKDLVYKNYKKDFLRFGYSY